MPRSIHLAALTTTELDGVTLTPAAKSTPKPIGASDAAKMPSDMIE